MNNFLYVAIGSAMGGVARWLVGSAVQRRFGGESVLPFPIGTLIVNVTGCFALGALAVVFARQGSDSSATRLLLAVGFCGGYTTFSTFSVDTVALLEGGSTALAAINVFGSLALAFTATFAGMLLMRAWLGRSLG